MYVRRPLVALAFASLVNPAASARQTASAPEALMDKMAGHWVMTGTIASRPARHDVDVDWVLEREYLRIHEISPDTDASGRPGYEAWIHIVWDAKNGEYAVMWLDNTAKTNFSPEGIGHAKPDGDRIPFIFRDGEGGGIHTIFAYDRSNDTWSWTIDNVDKAGKATPFAKVALTRR